VHFEAGSARGSRHGAIVQPRSCASLRSLLIVGIRRMLQGHWHGIFSDEVQHNCYRFFELRIVSFPCSLRVVFYLEVGETPWFSTSQLPLGL